MGPHFTQGKKPQHENCWLIPETVFDHDENKIPELKLCQTEKWDDLKPL